MSAQSRSGFTRFFVVVVAATATATLWLPAAASAGTPTTVRHVSAATSKHSEHEALSRATRLSAALYAQGIVAWTLVPSDDYSRVDVSGPGLEEDEVERLAHQIGDPIMGDIPFDIVPWDETRIHVNFDAAEIDQP